MMTPVIRRVGDRDETPLFDVGMGNPGMTSSGLPLLTWPEMTALRDALDRFLSDARNAENVSASG
jgi:hypothetical protein